MTRLSISINSNYEDVYEYLKDKPNRSNYICELVRRDMGGVEHGFTLEDVEKLIESKIKNLSQNEIEDNLLSDDIRGDLSSLFGL